MCLNFKRGRSDCNSCYSIVPSPFISLYLFSSTSHLRISFVSVVFLSLFLMFKQNYRNYPRTKGNTLWNVTFPCPCNRAKQLSICFPCLSSYWRIGPRLQTWSELSSSRPQSPLLRIPEPFVYNHIPVVPYTHFCTSLCSFIVAVKIFLLWNTQQNHKTLFPSLWSCWFKRRVFCSVRYNKLFVFAFIKEILRSFYVCEYKWLYKMENRWLLRFSWR
jgi:hypothetical protein